jgi:Ca2+-binding EF-hand superfamily protein
MSYEKAFSLVEECVHTIREEGEEFLLNLEGKRRDHEAEVTSTEYAPTSHPVLSSRKTIATISSARNNASVVIGARDFPNMEETNAAFSAPAFSAPAFSASASASPVGTSRPRVTFVDENKSTAVRNIFNKLDRHQSGEVNVRDLLVALRQDSVVANFLHLPMQIKQEDPSRTTMQHIFNVVDVNHDGLITWSEFSDYFDTNTYDLGSSSSNAAAAIPRQVLSNGRPGSPLARVVSTTPFNTPASPASRRSASSPRRGSIPSRHSSFDDISMYPLNLASSSHRRSGSVRSVGSAGSAGSVASSPRAFSFSDADINKKAMNTTEYSATHSATPSEEISRMKKLCEFLRASILHEREVVEQYVARLHDRELDHADTIDDMHLGDRGVYT